MGLLLSVCGSLSAYQLKSQRFVPGKYYIGQHVRTILEVQVQAEELQRSIFHMQAQPGQKQQDVQDKLDNALRISTQESLPNTLNYRIYQVDIFPGSTASTYNIEIIYAVFTTDISKLAEFDIEGFHIQALTVPRALSSLEKDDSSEGNYGNYHHELPSLESSPLSLPWVDLSIALLIQILVLLPIVIFQSSRKLRSWAVRLSESHRQRRPYRQFLRQLNILQQKESLGTQEYYRILSSQIRYYLSHRTQHPCSAYTTEELAQLKLGSLLEPLELWTQVLGVLQNSDDYRFRSSQSPVGSASEPLATGQRDFQLQTVIQFAKSVEKQFRKKQQELRHV